MSFRQHLKAWNRLTVRERQLTQMISRVDARIASLEDRLSPSSILGSIAQKYGNFDMPRADGVSDKVGNLVAEADEKLEDARITRASLMLQADDVRTQIAWIEDTLSPFSERHRIACVMIHRDRASWLDACEILHVSAARLYQLIDEVVEGVDSFQRLTSRERSFEVENR